MSTLLPSNLLNSSSLSAWPFEEAHRLLNRFQEGPPRKGYVLFETGYGPSGLPHIGTFGEVARTSMVRYAFSQISDLKTHLVAFSDDMDGLRKVPDNIPNSHIIAPHLGKPLTKIPDPFGTHESFGHHNNAMLQRFLDSFGFEYEFRSATDCYMSGVFDSTLKLVLKHYDEIMAILLPTLREERRATYSPFLPVCPRSGKVLQVPMVERHLESNTVVYKDPETNEYVEVPITGGSCKLQWKVDWGMRWKAFEVDYEMSGKDLIDSVVVSSKVCRVLGGNVPCTLTYEHFLDDKGAKISKSKGNGLTIDEWLTYAPTESLGYYMYQAPKRAKRLFFDVIPKSVDEYIAHLTKYPHQSEKDKLNNPVYHIHEGKPPFYEQTISFNLLLNLASVCHAEDEQILVGFVKRYLKQDLSSNKLVKDLIHYTVAYYKDFIAPNKVYREPEAPEKEAMLALKDELSKLKPDARYDEIQHIVFEVGKAHGFEDLKMWFGALYEVLLGQKEGPRIGSFIELYGVENMVKLIEERVGKGHI